MIKLSTIIFSMMLFVTANVATAAFIDVDPSSRTMPTGSPGSGQPSAADIAMAIGVSVDKVTILEKIDLPDEVNVNDEIFNGDFGIKILTTKEPGEDATTGQWTYNGEKKANAVVVKGANQFQVLFFDMPSMGNWDVLELENNGGNVPGLSNIQAIHVVPIPAAVWLFGSALIGLVGLRRRQQAS